MRSGFDLIDEVCSLRTIMLLAAGRGIEKNMVEAMKWHLLARTAGGRDSWLDAELNKLTPEEKAQVASALKQYIWNQRAPAFFVIPALVCTGLGLNSKNALKVF